MAFLIVVLAIASFIYCLRFYPQQSMSVGEQCKLSTPDVERYHNDCLHPCIRYQEDGRYVLVQSPWPAANDNVENPIVYFSRDPCYWGNGVVVKDSPPIGYNSDPTLFNENGEVFVFWREVDTPLCKKRGQVCVVLGGRLEESGYVSDVHIYIENPIRDIDVTMCPTLIKRKAKYYFYCTWYSYRPIRKNLGIAIWEGSSLEAPDFKLIDKVRFYNPLVCDKYVQKKLWGHLFFIPFPKRYDLWHFDLFEFKGNLYMVSSAEMDDSIMLSKSCDGKHFKTYRCPLINSHYSENIVGYRQFFYKPTAQVIDGDLYLWYTSNSGHPYNNKLFLSRKSMSHFVRLSALKTTIIT